MSALFILSALDAHASPPASQEANAVAIAIWRLNMREVVDADYVFRISGGSFDQAHFGAAIGFFETLTGISSNTASYAGRIPTPQFSATISAWSTWLTPIRQRALTFDPITCQVSLITDESLPPPTTAVPLH